MTGFKSVFRTFVAKISNILSMKRILILLPVLVMMCGCNFYKQAAVNENQTKKPKKIMSLNPTWPNVLGGIPAPQGFVRTRADNTSFAAYLRSLPLKPKGSDVLTYNGDVAYTSFAAYAVVKMDVGNRDLQQCADAIIRLRAEWLYSQKRYDEIAFHFVSGFLCEYKKWAEGYRITVKKGGSVSWTKSAQKDYSYQNFRRYLDRVFEFASTISLAKETKPVKFADMQIGDILITPGAPGHSVIIADMVSSPITGEKRFLVAESYMPAQEIHILATDPFERNSPWFSLSELVSDKGIEFLTCTFPDNSLRRF